jgi:hypothetical protein
VPEGFDPAGFDAAQVTRDLQRFHGTWRRTKRSRPQPKR